MSIRRLMVLPHLIVHNANALSSPFSIGFPAVTAFMGFTHALQRILNSNGYPSLKFLGTAVISHRCDLQTFRGEGDFVNSIVATANPLDKDGERPSFVEEARCDLDVSVLIEYQAKEDDEEALLLPDTPQLIRQHLMRLKVAGGDLQSVKAPVMYVIEATAEAANRKLMRSLMPGFALVERRELMKQAMEQGQDAMDALLEYLTVHHTCTEDDGVVTWTSHRKTNVDGNKLGWIVPIATGFHGISELGHAKNQRDPDTLHRFAESVITLGEFRMAHRITHLDDVLWRYHTDGETNLYLCQQAQTTNDDIENDGFY